VEFLDLSKRL
jgi:dCMP deaminase